MKIDFYFDSEFEKSGIDGRLDGKRISFKWFVHGIAVDCIQRRRVTPGIKIVLEDSDPKFWEQKIK